MLLARDFVAHMASEVVKRLVEGGQIEVKAQDAVTTRIRQRMLEELTVEDRLNEEVRQILVERQDEMRSTGVSYQEMYKKVKQHLARDRKLVLLHLFVYFLVRHAGAAHLILALHEDLPHFIVKPVFHGQLLEHSLADARGHRILGLNLNLLALHEALHHFTSHVSHKIACEQHLWSFPWCNYKQVSLLA